MKLHRRWFLFLENFSSNLLQTGSPVSDILTSGALFVLEHFKVLVMNSSCPDLSCTAPPVYSLCCTNFIYCTVYSKDFMSSKLLPEWKKLNVCFQKCVNKKNKNKTLLVFSTSSIVPACNWTSSPNTNSQKWSPVLENQRWQLETIDVKSLCAGNVCTPLRVLH